MKAAAAIAVAAVVAACFASNPASSGVVADGVFHASCPYSHTLPDDPLRDPGLPGASHLHDFFGNASTDAFATGDSLVAANTPLGSGTTCHRPGDGAGYWTPGLFDCAVTPCVHVLPTVIDTYYRGGFDPSQYQAVTPPTGFGEIIGKNGNGYLRWGCDLHGNDLTAPAQCDSGELVAKIYGSASCWDGVNLFLQDQSHVSGDGPTKCTARGWKIIPTIIGFVVYKNIGTGVHDWRLAPEPATPDVYQPTDTIHLDIFIGWDQPTLSDLIRVCLNTPANRPSPLDPCRGAST